MMAGYEDLLSFWFEEIDPKTWWLKDRQFDDLIRERFAGMHAQAVAGELYEWRRSPHGRLAEVIVIDQFSRNLFRGSAKSFQFDPLALALAQEAVATGADLEIAENRRAFLYMPFMHSESKVIHRQAIKLFETLGSNLERRSTKRSSTDSAATRTATRSSGARPPAARSSFSGSPAQASDL
jgi:uncharacterized protein (DUF924 family)